MDCNKLMSIDDIRRVELNILNYVHYICEKHNLKYVIAGGTLLGAVRHKGYIPWDDDIDILMPRNDYEKLIRIINYGKNKNFRILTYKNDLDYLMPFGRVVDTRTYVEFPIEINSKKQGVFIDVFPMDGIDEKNNYFSNKVRTIEHIRCENNRSILKMFYAKILCLSLDIKARRQSYTECDNVACKVVGMGKREIISKELINERILMRFENRMYYAPVGYDKYLRNLYKDYMKLPPKHMQRRGHMFCAWYRKKV